jgi:nitrite reductase (NO-forming)
VQVPAGNRLLIDVKNTDSTSVHDLVLDSGADSGRLAPGQSTVVGGQFDTVFQEGAYLLRRGNPEHGASQVLSLGPAQGGFVELSFRQPGHYPFVSHLMVDAERGAHGIIRVTR